MNSDDSIYLTCLMIDKSWHKSNLFYVLNRKWYIRNLWCENKLFGDYLELLK